AVARAPTTALRWHGGGGRVWGAGPGAVASSRRRVSEELGSRGRVTKCHEPSRIGGRGGASEPAQPNPNHGASDEPPAPLEPPDHLVPPSLAARCLVAHPRRLRLR